MNIYRILFILGMGVQGKHEITRQGRHRERIEGR